MYNIVSPLLSFYQQAAGISYLFEWLTLQFDLNIYFSVVITWVIARGCSDPINQHEWTSYTSVFLTYMMKAIHKQKWLVHTPWGQTTMVAVLLPTSRWPILCLFPSGPFCLGSPWISLSFHHSLMSSCSCQHLLTASNSLQHTGSWDPCDELQSAVCRGGFTLSRANQGKHPLPKGRVSTDRLSPSYPIITLPLPLCCKLLHLNPVSRGTDTLVITSQSV